MNDMIITFPQSYYTFFDDRFVDQIWISNVFLFEYSSTKYLVVLNMNSSVAVFLFRLITDINVTFLKIIIRANLIYYSIPPDYST